MAVTRLSFVDPALAPRRLQASPEPVRLQVARMGPPGATPVVTAEGIGAATAAALAAETSARAAADAAHAGALDPHPQYLTAAEASAAYSALGHGHVIGDTTGLQAALDEKQSVAGLAAAVNALIASAAGVVTQAYSAVLTELAALTPTTFGKSLLGLAGAAALRTSVALPTTTTAGRLARYTDAAGTQGQTVGLYEDASGNVGIGTASPQVPLHVKGSGINSEGGLLIDTGITAKTSYQAVAVGSDLLSFFGNNVYVDGALSSQRFDTSRLAWSLVLDGRSSQDLFKLERLSAAGATMRPMIVRGDGSFGFGNLTAVPAFTGAKFMMDSSGNVGIQTTTPVAACDVNGAIRRKTYTVATLPSAALGDGMAAFVSDSSQPLAVGVGAAVTGGGANYVPVFSRAGAWLVG